MTAPKPHYLLFCDGNVSANGENAGSQRGRWRFVLEDLVSGERIEATDQEIACAPDRSALVAVLRGLEALEQPSRVTLVTTSRYVTRGLQYGLSEWRDNDYSWEHFGAVQPIRNADIWKRIDRALAYHQVQCRWMAQEGTTEPQDEPSENKGAQSPAAQSPAAPSAACVETLKSSSVQTAHRRSRTVDGTRTNISANKVQRVYVDTPTSSGSPNDCQPVLSRPSDPLANEGQLRLMPAASTSVFDGNRLENRKSRQRLPMFFQNSTSRRNGFVNLLLSPFWFACRGPVWLCRHFWDAILAIDEWLESFLRCFFLLDPSKKPTRR